MKAIQDYIDSLTRRVAREANVDPDGEARRELASHLFDLAASRALGRQLTRADVDSAWAELAPNAIYLLREDPERRTDPATRVRPANWPRRIAAYVADFVANLGVFGLVAITFLERLHDRHFIVALLLFVVTVLSFNSVLESHRGATPGKMLVQVRTVDRHGNPPSLLSAFVITLPKVFPPALAVDVLLGLVGGFHDRLRLTERLVNVRVIEV